MQKGNGLSTGGVHGTAATRLVKAEVARRRIAAALVGGGPFAWGCLFALLLALLSSLNVMNISSCCFRRGSRFLFLRASQGQFLHCCAFGNLCWSGSTFLIGRGVRLGIVVEVPRWLGKGLRFNEAPPQILKV